MIKLCMECNREYETEEERCPKCGSQLGVPNGSGGYLFRPTAVIKEVPSMEYAELVCMIPQGQVATEDDIEAFFCRRYNADRITYVSPRPLYAKSVGDKLKPVLFSQSGEKLCLIPYWRVLSQRGYISRRDLYADRLREEGLDVVKSGRSLRVMDYKEKRFGFANMLTIVKEGRLAWPF